MVMQDATEGQWVNDALEDVGLPADMENNIRALVRALDDKDPFATKLALLKMEGARGESALITGKPTTESKRERRPIQVRAAHSDEESIAVEQLSAKLTQEVAALRKQLFGSERNPFYREPEVAAQWIRDQVPKTATRSPREQAELETLREELARVRRELAERLGARLPPLEIPTLEFYGEVAKGYVWREVAPVRSGSALEPLAAFVERNVGPVGCSSPELVHYVLCGGRLPFRRLRLRTHETIGAAPNLIECTITLRGHHLSEEDFRAAYRAFRAASQAAGRPSPLDKADRKILATIRRLGGPPAPQKRDLSSFLRQVADNANLPYQGVRSRYYRRRLAQYI